MITNKNENVTDQINRNTWEWMQAYAKEHPKLESSQQSPALPSAPQLRAPANPPPSTAAPVTDWSTVDPLKLSIDDLEKLFLSAHAGDANAAVAFKKFMSNGGSAVWREAGDLARVAEKALFTAVYKGNSALCLSGRRRAQEMRAELAADDATPLEKVAIDRVVLASMFSHAVDAYVAMHGARAITSTKMAKVQLAADQRLNAALKSLKTAREISRAAVAGPLRLFGSRPRETAAPIRAATA